MSHFFTLRVVRRAGRRRRGMTMIELLVGLIVVATAAVGTAIAVFNAYGQLQRQRHRLIANQYLRAEVEYWQGRIHAAMPSTQEMNRNTKYDAHMVVIDKRDPSTDADDIIGQVWREPLHPKIMVNSSQNKQYYWEIPVAIEYIEPSWSLYESEVTVNYQLVGYWLEAEPTNFAGQ